MDPELTPDEKLLAIDIQERDKPSMAAVAAALGAAFLLHRGIMKRKLKEATATPPTRHRLIELNKRLFSTMQGQFIATLVPSLVAGYRHGLREVDQGLTSAAWTTKVATTYAQGLTEVINETSSKALVDGFTTMLNRKVPARMAIDRAIDAYGVAPRTMKALVNIWLGPAPAPSPTALPLSNRIAERADSMIAKAIEQRAEVFGESEAYVTKNQAKSLMWMYRADRYPGAKVVWYTASDERVCAICGPMHGKTRELTGQFKIRGFGKAWAPPLHPACRCEILLAETVGGIKATLEQAEQLQGLVEPDDIFIVRKDFKEWEHPRAKTGRFVAKPKPKLATREREVEPAVAQLVQQARAVREQEAPREKKEERPKLSWAAPPVTSSGVGWAAPKEGWRSDAPPARWSAEPQQSWAEPAKTAWSEPGQGWASPEDKAPWAEQPGRKAERQRTKWYRVPLQDAMFALIPPEAGSHLTSTNTRFYKASTSGGEHPADQALREYWDDRIFDHIQDIMDAETEHIDGERTSDGGILLQYPVFDETEVEYTALPEGLHRIKISQSQYQKLWQTVLYPDKKLGSGYIEVTHMDSGQSLAFHPQALIDHFDMEKTISAHSPLIGVVPYHSDESKESDVEVYPPNTEWQMFSRLDDIPDIPEIGVYHNARGLGSAYSGVTYLRPAEAES